MDRNRAFEGSSDDSTQPPDAVGIELRCGHTHMADSSENGTSLGAAKLPDPTVALRFEYGKPIFSLFSEVADRVPHSIALCDGPFGITYADLELWSSAVANELTKMGSGRGAVVTIYSSEPI